MVVFQNTERFFGIFNRYFCFVCTCIITILILLAYIINPISIITKAEYCDALRIQEYYMNNHSVSQLLKTKPIYSNFFEYEIVNDKFCKKDDLDIDLLIFIISKVNSYERRHAIRRTYGNLNNVFKYISNSSSSSKLDIRILFLINIDEYRMKTIEFEQKLFNDIVQVKIPDESVLNIYRDLSIFDWSSKYCPQARFILKMDDSVFLNPFLLIKFINENENDRFHLELKSPLDISTKCPIIDARLPLLYGFIHSNKQSSSLNNEYPCDIYPNYLNDHIYLISNDARDLILCTFYRQSTFLYPLSNIYLTGILAEYLNIKRQSFNNDEKILSCETSFHTFACIINDNSSKNLLQQYLIYWKIILNENSRIN